MGRVGRKKRMKAFRKSLGVGFNTPAPIVFDGVKRTDNSPKRNTEGDFFFYNRSARTEIDRIRNFIEACVKNYPHTEQKEIISRLRSGDDVHFRSACFEVFLYEALSRQGFTLTPHPELPNGSPYRPDFIVSDTEGRCFYLEAVLATENNELDRGGEARKGAVLDTLSKFPHDNFMIALDDEGSPKSPPAGKKLKNKIHAWLDSLDPDEVHENIDSAGFDSIEPLVWSHDDWHLQIRPIPLKPERRGQSSTLIGIGGMGGGWIDAWSPIRDAIKFKGGKYGDLEIPLVVAVNLDSFHLDRIDEMQALFGQEQFVFKPGSDAEPEMRRAPNGAWYGKRGPQYRRVSAAWIFNDLHASSLAVRNSTIYLNPWAALPAPESLKSFPFAELQNDKMYWNEGLSFREIFELHEGWPENA
tara:strand:+ start:836 stop:2077 length:1242 start_codon:yes stop_codon:yes gene_type:complete